MPHHLLALALALVACSDSSSGAPPGNAAGVGNVCRSNADCPTNDCYLGPWGGYCTAPCTQEGETAGCPVDTVCKPIQGRTHKCLLVCGSQTSCGRDTCPDDFCPTGSSCVSIGGSSLRACEPNP